MKIIVFVKQIKYIYAQTGTDPKQNFIGPDDIINIINPLDESAVEEALRIREKLKDYEVVAISLGNYFVEEALRKCLSMGVDKAVHLFAGNYEKMDAWVTAMVLAYSIRNFQFDLILCGREAVDNQNSLVGPYIANLLNIPYLSSVINLEMDRVNEKVLVQRAVERGNREIIECRIPALVAVEKGINIPRYPTLSGILKAQHQMIEKIEIERLGLPMDQIGSDSNLTETTKLSTPKPKSRGTSSEDRKLSASDRLNLLLKGTDPKKKQGPKLLEGTSEKILSEIERLLEENGIISE